jgi:cytochrome c oxidase subunit 2
MQRVEQFYPPRRGAPSFHPPVCTIKEVRVRDSKEVKGKGFVNQVRRCFFVFLMMVWVVPAFLGAQAERTITIHAKRYQFVPGEITLVKGEPVRLVLISDDVDHGLAVKGLGIREEMPKHKTVEVEVTPEQTGDFPGSCSRFCGAGHAEMKFIVHVVEKQ